MTIKWDGHTHTKFCCHGSSADQEQYLDLAIELGFERYTISEHPPLPAGWVNDAQLMAELAMPESVLPDYIRYVKDMKAKYEGRLDIVCGLELDYLEGRLDYTERIVDACHKDLEDVVYSVHYLPGVGGMRCIDFTPQDFRDNLLTYYGTMEKLVDEYYNHVETAIAWVSGLPMRKRLGHINLIRKFQRVLSEIDEAQVRRRLERVIPLLVQGKVGIDVNTAGLRVETCGEAYVPEWFLAECRKQGVECVYGSDAHKPDHLGTGWDWYAACILK
jgi:histidinol-phosphatase (PHP family)